MKKIKQKEFAYLSPFIHTSRSVRSIYFTLIILLLPQLALLFLQHDLYAVLNIFSATTATLICQGIVYYAEKSTFTIPLQAILQGLFIGFFMPNNIGFFFVFLLSFLGFFLTKVAFGKAGRWLHSSAIVLIIAYLSRPELFSLLLQTSITNNIGSVTTNAIASIPSFSAQTQLLSSPLDSAVTSFLNAYILNNLGVSLPEGYLSLFWNSSHLIPALRYNLLTIIASIILLSLKIYDYTISFLFLFAYSIFVYCFGKISTHGLFEGDMLYSLMSGGLLFITFFAMGEPHSFPKTTLFKVLSGIFIASFSFLLSKGEASFITIAFAILLLNVISPSIEELEKKLKGKRSFI